MANPATRRIRPLDALRAMRALLRDPDDTVQVFRIVDALSGNSGERLFRRFRHSSTGAAVLREKRQLVETLENRDELLALPPGTLGHTYAEFMQREQISAGGLMDASVAGGRDRAATDPARRLVGDRFRDQHDLWHVVTGYNRDLVGEAALLAFTLAQTWNPGIGFIVAVAWFKLKGDFGYGRTLLRQAFRRGRRSEWLPAQDWEALLRQPLAEVRRELRVGAPPEYAQRRSAGAPAMAS